MSESKTVSLRRIAHENLMNYDDATIYHNDKNPGIFVTVWYSISHIFLRNSKESFPSNQCTLTVCLTCNRYVRERQRKVNIQHEDRPSWAFRVFIHVQQYPVLHKKQSIFRMKKVASSFLVQLHWRIQNTSCTLKVPMFSKSSSNINPWLSNYQGLIQSRFCWWLFKRISAMQICIEKCSGNTWTKHLGQYSKCIS